MYRIVCQLLRSHIIKFYYICIGCTVNSMAALWNELKCQQQMSKYNSLTICILLDVKTMLQLHNIRQPT